MKKKDYKKELDSALSNNFLRSAMEKFAVAYRDSRTNVFSTMDVDGLIETIANSKDKSICKMEQMFESFKTSAEKKGIKVHLAKDAKAANQIILEIAKNGGVKSIVKSKSMTSEEIRLNHYLEDYGIEVIETDLGEWIIQLRNEGPSHMVMPAIHLSKEQVTELFSDVTGETLDPDIQTLVKVARKELRDKYLTADMGISGANFAIAETGTIGIVTNEGNARLVTTLPKIHVALVGLEKIVPDLDSALDILNILPKNATGQNITSYVTWITGSNECYAATDNRKEIHIVFLDNGRMEMSKNSDFAEVLRCIRCGACANVCPVYRMVGGHGLGHIYIGAIGLILTFFFHGTENAESLVQNCINCGACKDVCAAGIDLPGVIKKVQSKIIEDKGKTLSSSLLSKILLNRNFFHRLLKAARVAQKPLVGKEGFLRHLPLIVSKDHNFRALPKIADRSFRDMWEDIKYKLENPELKVSVFAGCLQDFVYPEHLISAIEILKSENVQVSFSEGQSCCGLPLEMMGDSNASKNLAKQNIDGFALENSHYILTLCGSCGSFLKKYSDKLTENPKNPDYKDKAKLFSEKIILLSDLLFNVLKLSENDFDEKAAKVLFHSSCHAGRGLKISNEPRELITKAGYKYVETTEENTCCGFGGTYSGKFPNISSNILEMKMNSYEGKGDILVTECPGCVLQLTGGFAKKDSTIEVKHLSEILCKGSLK
ncbi:MAG: 4Fe-4S dicluster domain-containing protein [Deltaproteobacteria bacterium]|nr:4Fe-4S dicluster domain-containing protein [Deltaproteobacteria bacterium]